LTHEVCAVEPETVRRFPYVQNLRRPYYSRNNKTVKKRGKDQHGSGWESGKVIDENGQ